MRQISRLLVVDADAAFADLLADFLGNRKLSVRTAGDRASALRVVREFSPQLVVLDFSTHRNNNGLALLASVRTLAPECGVILMTAHPGDSIVRGALAAGVGEILFKPFPLTVLKAAVERCAQGSRFPPRTLPDRATESSLEVECAAPDATNCAGGGQLRSSRCSNGCGGANDTRSASFLE
jgi:DNA-binding NtrC family response regulator